MERVWIHVTADFGSETEALFSDYVSLPAPSQGTARTIDLAFFSDLVRLAVAARALRLWTAVQGKIHVTVMAGAVSDAFTFTVYSSRLWITGSDGIPVGPDSCRFRFLLDADTYTIPIEYRGDLVMPVFVSPGVSHTFRADVSVRFDNGDGVERVTAFYSKDPDLFGAASIPQSPADSTELVQSAYPVKLNLDALFDSAPVAVRSAAEIISYDLVVTHNAVYDDSVTETFSQSVLFRARSMYNPARFSYRNLFCFSSDIWLSVSKDSEAEGAGSAAVVGGTLVDYDRRTEHRLNIASYAPPSMATQVLSMVDALHSFNGVQCVPDKIGAKRADDGTLRFTATLRRADRAPWT